MTITLNGEQRVVEGPMNLGGLLEVLGLSGRPVVVELNREALLPKELATAEIREGDVVEIVQITAGG